MVDRTTEFLSAVEILRGTTPVKPVVIQRRARYEPRYETLV